MITGASSGIGRETALGLARLGATLVLVCRDRGRGQDTVADIRRLTGNEDVSLLLADLSSQASIRRLAAEFLESRRPWHVLVNNAGVVNVKRTLTIDGIETVFAVNHLAYFLLTHLLLDRLQASAPARIVNVASHAHRFGTLDFDDLEGAGRYGPMRRYGQSKLANILFTYELARRLDPERVTVNCLHPGAVATGLGKNNGGWARVITSMLRPFFRTPAQGAETSIHLAAAPELDGITGQYFVDCKPAASSAQSHDTAAARRLWDISARMTGISI